MYSNIVIQIFAVDLDFTRCKVGSLIVSSTNYGSFKRNSCDGECMRATLNELLKAIKLVLPVQKLIYSSMALDSG